MGSSITENYNNNDSNPYLQKTYSYYIGQTPKGASNMQRIAQLLRSIKKLETIINMKSNFRRVSIFHEKIGTYLEHLKLKTFKNRTPSLIKILLVLIKKGRGTG